MHNLDLSGLPYASISHTRNHNHHHFFYIWFRKLRINELENSSHRTCICNTNTQSVNFSSHSLQQLGYYFLLDLGFIDGYVFMLFSLLLQKLQLLKMEIFKDFKMFLLPCWKIWYGQHHYFVNTKFNGKGHFRLWGVVVVPSPSRRKFREKKTKAMNMFFASVIKIL